MWELSNKGIAEVRQYVSLFPEVVKAVMADPSQREYTVAALFGGGSQAHKRLEALLDWKKSLQSYHIPLVPVESITMGANAVVACEKAQDVVCEMQRKKSKKQL